MTGLWVDGIPRPDHGEGMMQRACRCGAGWVGLRDDPCGWCAAAVERMVDDQRRRLLWPEWADTPGSRYDELSPVDRQVWDRTRGIQRGDASRARWLERLAGAVAADVISEQEARDAVARVDRKVARHA